MSEVNLAEKANEIFETLCAALDSRGWHYEKDESVPLVHFELHGEDIPMRMIIAVDQKRQVVRLLSRLPFTMTEEHRIEGAIATCAVTSKLVNGCFDFDILEGSITFRLTASYRESRLGKGLFLYMVDCAAAMVDDYNDQFLALNKGRIDVGAFIDGD